MEFGSNVVRLSQQTLSVERGFRMGAPEDIHFKLHDGRFKAVEHDLWSASTFNTALDGHELSNDWFPLAQFKSWISLPAVASDGRWISRGVLHGTPSSKRGCAFLYNHGTHSMCRSDHSCYCREGYGGADCGTWLGEN